MIPHFIAEFPLRVIFNKLSLFPIPDQKKVFKSYFFMKKKNIKE